MIAWGRDSEWKHHPNWHNVNHCPKVCGKQHSCLATHPYFQLPQSSSSMFKSNMPPGQSLQEILRSRYAQKRKTLELRDHWWANPSTSHYSLSPWAGEKAASRSWVLHYRMKGYRNSPQPPGEWFQKLLPQAHGGSTCLKSCSWMAFCRNCLITDERCDTNASSQKVMGSPWESEHQTLQQPALSPSESTDHWPPSLPKPTGKEHRPYLALSKLHFICRS